MGVLFINNNIGAVKEAPVSSEYAFATQNMRTAQLSETDENPRPLIGDPKLWFDRVGNDLGRSDIGSFFDRQLAAIQGRDYLGPPTERQAATRGGIGTGAILGGPVGAVIGATTGYGAEVGTVAGSLSTSNADYGFVIGIEGGFEETYSKMNRVPIAQKAPMGELRMNGIAFSRVCDRNLGNVNSTRHGLEGLLYWYWHRRISAPNGKVNRVHLGIGATRFINCFVVGLDFSHQDANYNLWRWTIKFLADPDYRPVKLS